MAKFSLVAQDVTRRGVMPDIYDNNDTPPLSQGNLATGNGDMWSWPNEDNVVLRVETGNTQTVVRIQRIGLYDGDTQAPRAIRVPVNSEMWIANFPVDIYGPEVVVSFSSVTNLEVSLLRI